MAIFATADGVRLRIRVQPSASRSEVVGRHGDALRIRLASPPVDGKANDALIALLSDLLGVPRRAVTLRAGMGNRSKVVDVVGPTVAAASQALLGES